MALQRTTVTVPEDLSSSRVDRLAGPRGRSAFVAEAISAKVRRERLRRAIEETRGVLIAAVAYRLDATVVTRRAADLRPFEVEVLGHADDGSDAAASRRIGTKRRSTP